MTNDISNAEDIIDVRDVIARVEELREERQPFAAGWNMCGYMPDAEPGTFADIEDARAYIVEELESRAEQMREDAEQLPDGSLEGADARQVLLEKASELEQAAQYASEQESAFSVVVCGFAFWVADAENGGLDAEDAAELAELESLLSDLAGYGGDEEWEGDWYPVTLIRDTYFEDAMRELCEEIGDMPKGFPSYMVIDWEATADNLRVDYSSVEYGGVTYWYR